MWLLTSSIRGGRGGVFPRPAVVVPPPLPTPAPRPRVTAPAAPMLLDRDTLPLRAGAGGREKGGYGAAVAAACACSSYRGCDVDGSCGSPVTDSIDADTRRLRIRTRRGPARLLPGPSPRRPPPRTGSEAAAKRLGMRARGSGGAAARERGARRGCQYITKRTEGGLLSLRGLPLLLVCGPSFRGLGRSEGARPDC